MPTKSDAHLINEWLDGSPYSFPTDDDGEAKARSLLKEQVRLLERQRMVSEQFAHEAASIREELEHDFEVRFVFESNAIEGVATTFPETLAFLSGAQPGSDYISAYSFSRQVVEDPKILEVTGHGEALRVVKTLASGFEGRQLREVDVRNIHRLVMASEPRLAGTYKATDNRIGGRDDLLTARSDDVGHHMNQLMAWMNAASFHGPLLAAVVHGWLAYIHPFEDGNGRVARLLANYVLYRGRWPCLIIRSSAERGEYYDALQHSDDGGDIAPLFSLFVRGLDRTLTEMADPSFARTLIHADLERQNAYESWAALQGAFTSRLAQLVQQNGLDFQVVGALAASDFEYLRRRDPSGNGWFAMVQNPKVGTDLLLWFGFQSDPLRADVPSAKLTPSIFVSERDHSPAATHPYRPLWGSLAFPVEEVSLQPKAKSDRVLLRTSQGTRPCGLEEGAKTLASALKFHGRA